jgi:uncharacterized protein YcbK (DUF882 family)
MSFAYELLLAMGAGALLGLALTVPINDDDPLSLGLAARASAAAPSASAAPLGARGRKDHALPSEGPSLVRYGEVVFRSQHTKEAFTVPAEGIAGGPALDAFLRCRVTGDTTHMEPRPAQVALAMARRFHATEVIVVSAFRSARFNEMLRKKGHQVAKQSQHPQGHALDFRIPGVPVRRLAAAIAEEHVGGIGTYRRSGFVHVDTGPKRDWQGR